MNHNPINEDGSGHLTIKSSRPWQTIFIDVHSRRIPPGGVASSPHGVFKPPLNISATDDVGHKLWPTMGEQDRDDDIQRRLLAASPKEFSDAALLAEQVRRYLAGESSRPPEIKKDTWRRKVAAYRSAVETHGCGFYGLLKRERKNGSQ